ncbi:Ankyrin repeat and KH domain-containing protein mask [Durusdinium trenchii]|uniref:Ankyrin repeat and KH domain-containing protein mask n=1 Tax=Durusdinium trenchii TaxID=1381693 RepID=A0ABP0LCI6_9DINO
MHSLVARAAEAISAAKRLLSVVSETTWKERCEFLAGLQSTPASKNWWYLQQVVWLYLSTLGLHAGWCWSANWKRDGEHSDLTAWLGGLKTVGFGCFDLLALLALKASRHAYALPRVQELLGQVAAEHSELMAKKCCCWGFLQALVQALYWILFIHSILHKNERDMVRVLRTASGALGLVLCTPGLCCAFFPVLLGLSEAESRLSDLAKGIEQGRVPLDDVLSKYAGLAHHVNRLAKELSSTVMWLLLAFLAYTLMQCCSVWLWIDKVSLAPCSVYVTYALAVLYGSTFAIGHALFGGVEQQQSEIRSALASRLVQSPQDAQTAVLASLYIKEQPIKWKVPLSPKWPMAGTFERFQGALLVGSCAGKVGLQLIEAGLQVQNELSEATKSKLKDKFKKLSPDTLLARPDSENVKQKQRSWPSWLPRLPRLQLPWRQLSLPKNMMQVVQSAGPKINAKAHQQSSPALAFVPAGSSAKVLALLLLALLQVRPRSRGGSKSS